MTKDILIGCEYSGTVRDAFRKRGFNALSCDILPTEKDPEFHLQIDITLAIMSQRWAGIILHIPCTAMALCGNKHYGKKDGVPLPKHNERLESVNLSCSIVELALEQSDNVLVENPASVIFPELRRRFGMDVQFVQPWQHGHPEQKKTGFALKGFPRILPTNNVYDEMLQLPRSKRERIFMMGPSANRGLERSRFYPGIAAAMAHQLGDYLLW